MLTALREHGLACRCSFAWPRKAVAMAPGRDTVLTSAGPVSYLEIHTMGLDAVVFRNVGNLERLYGRGLFDLDEATGEAILRSEVAVQVPRAAFIAESKRIGNVAEIDQLREMVTNTLGSGSSLMLNKVLYSGSHCGDSIGIDELGQLRREIDILKSLDATGMNAFVQSITALIRAAEQEHNAIVFV